MFHTRPTWHDGKVYVATMDYSKIDAGYLERRGFHWYVYDPAIGALTDLRLGPSSVDRRELKPQGRQRRWPAAWQRQV